jgi:serine/threonine protein kinase/class 3 adenylate cyclase
MSDAEPREQARSGLRHVTILFSDIVGFSDLTRRVGDVEAARVANRLLTLQEIIITRDALGQVLQFGGDSAFAVFDNASVALNRALEIQRVLSSVGPDGPGNPQPGVRIGLHMGEVLVREGERIEIISRHVNRAHRIMEAAAPGQILASDVVVDAARDFLDIPREHQAIRHYGEFYLRGVGATGLCEVADLRFRQPEPPRVPGTDNAETALLSRLELAGYRPVARLGEGAFGVVYRAERADTGQQVAVKVLNPALCEDQAARQRFADEVERSQRLNVPGVVRVIERRLDHQPPFFATQLVEGKPVDAALAGAAAQRIARVFRSICAILEQAHAAGVIHCDLKPGNILVRADDSVVLMDFGISVLAGTTPAVKPSSTTLLGTPAFLAPEIIQGEPRGLATDIYSLGALLFKVLTGREPFVGETVHDVVQAHLYEDPPPPVAFNPDVADGLQRICLKALEKNPKERYPGARQMADDLDRFLRGEMVRTRPTVYDNLLYHRVQKHVEQIKEWTTRGLLNAEESHRLLSSYEGLQRRGLPAVMEGRLFRLWQTLVYVGGWAVINGALLWLMQHWDSLSRAGKLSLGSVPALTTFALAGTMWRLERFRLFFVALIVAVLATPLLTGVWLHEFNIAATVPANQLGLELFHDSAGSTALTNQQMLLTALVTLIVAGGVMAFTRTTTHSAQALTACALFYTACLLPHGLRPQVDHEQWARIALEYVPLLLAASAIGGMLLQREDRHYQAPPWIYFAAVLLLAILDAVPLHGLEEWTSLAPEYRTPLSFLLVSGAGAVQAMAGLAARGLLRHRCRLATLTVIFAGLVTVLVGFGVAGWEDTWPKAWLHLTVLGKSVPFPHVVLPVAALVITLAACRYQMLAFLMVGLAGLAFSIHVLGHLYFKELPTWPKLLMVLGAACFFTALYRELRRTRGNTIDDVVSQSRL